MTLDTRYPLPDTRSPIPAPRWYRLAINGQAGKPANLLAPLTPEQLERLTSAGHTIEPAAPPPDLQERLTGLLQTLARSAPTQYPNPDTQALQGPPVGAAERASQQHHRNLGTAAPSPSAAPTGAPLTGAHAHFSSLTPGRAISPAPAPGETPIPEVVP